MITTNDLVSFKEEKQKERAQLNEKKQEEVNQINKKYNELFQGIDRDLELLDKMIAKSKENEELENGGLI